ncbi:ABC transporter substrate-binding protein [Amycolatopsis pigmentata]|uniref:ABC transporter substrate-binding protein n=1 Tax=Amycolatopsis pigmentata TaxID=450801 RepID=A0ABW5FUW8_9PSEU
MSIIRSFRRSRGSGRWPLVALVVCVLALAACAAKPDSGGAAANSGETVLGPAKAATGTPVTIGVLGVAGGPYSIPSLGEQATATASYVNEHLGGIAGHPVKVDVCNDLADGPSATACANRFVDEHVTAVVSLLGFNFDQFTTILAQAGIPYIGAAGPVNVPETSTPGLYFFQGGPAPGYAAVALYAQRKGWKKLTLVSFETPVVTQLLDSMARPIYRQAGIDLSFSPVPIGSPDVAPQIQAALATHPDAILVQTDPTSCLTVLRALDTVGSRLPVIGFPNCGATSVVDAMRSRMNLTDIQGAAATSDSAEAKLYHAIMSHYSSKTDTGGLASNGYIGIMGLARLVNASGLTGEIDARKVGQAIATAPPVQRPGGLDTETMSCGHSVYTIPQVKSVICDSRYYVSEITKGVRGPVQSIDSAQFVQTAFGA